MFVYNILSYNTFLIYLSINTYSKTLIARSAIIYYRNLYFGIIYKFTLIIL